MIARLLVKVGLSAAIPYLVQIALGSALFGGGLMTWLAGWSDWQTSVLLVFSLTLVAFLATSNSKASRVGMALVIGATLYIKGRIDEDVSHEAEMDSLKTSMEISHKADIARMRAAHDAALKVEEERQARISETLKQQAEAEKDVFDKAVSSLKEELRKIKEGAKDAADADSPVLDTDDVRSLNRLRHDPKQRKPGRTPVRRGKAKTSQGPVLDASPLSKTAGVPRKADEKAGSGGWMGLGFLSGGSLPASTLGLGQACEGAGCSISWRGF
jgi:hypothetical protein